MLLLLFTSFQAKVVGGRRCYLLGSGSGFPSARAAPAARDERLQQLCRQGRVSSAVVQRTLNLAEGSLPRSRVRGVNHSASHAPAGMPWYARLPHLGGTRARFPTQRAAETAVLASYLTADSLRRAVLMLQGEPAEEEDGQDGGQQRQRRQRPLGPAERAELVVGLATARSVQGARPPQPPALEDAAGLAAWPEEACLAEEGLRGSEARERRVARTRGGRLLLCTASSIRRHEALAATRRGLLREPHMPPEHYFGGLSREQAVVVVEQQSELSLLDCDGHLDHRKPLCWGTAQSTDVLQLDNIDLIHRCGFGCTLWDCA